MISCGRLLLSCGFALLTVAIPAAASAQVVYYPAYRPVVAAPVVAAPVIAPVTAVSTYVPAGNYAAVTAMSPPVAVAAPAVAVRSYYAPAYTPMAAAPIVTTAGYAAPVTTTYYAPAAVAPVVAAPVAVAPVTAYYAPAVVAPVYRRGPLGVYRPVRTAYFIPY